MRLVIPVSTADKHLLDVFVNLFIATGGATRHPVLFLPTRSMLPRAKVAAASIENYCRSIEVVPWDKDNVDKWPVAGNVMFQHAVIEIMKIENEEKAKGIISQPWYFFELDNTILKPNAFDALESEYAVSGCRYMGAVVPTRIIVNGQMTTEEFIEGQPQNIPHMVGTGIYPPNFNADVQGQWKFAKFDSWDVFLRYYMARSRHHTNLIQHRWSTINYRREGDKIICDNDPKNPFGTDHSGEVDPNAVILHGCKDGSLAKIVLESLGQPSLQAQAKAVLATVSTERVLPPEEKPTVVLPKFQEDKAAWGALKAKSQSTETKGRDASEDIEKIASFLESKPKGAFARVIAESVGLTEDKVKEVFAKNKDLFKKAPYGRIQLATAEV